MEGPLGLPHNGDKKLMVTFLGINMMPFHKTNLKSIIPLLLKDTITAYTSTIITLPLSQGFYIIDSHIII